jgi:ArsR family transcriptional regulator
MRELALFYAALSDETRLRLLCLMRGREVCVCHLQGVLGTNQPKISRHLAYLRKAGLVEMRRDGKWRHYRLKKIDGDLEAILSRTLAHLEQQPRIKKDSDRLGRATC